MNTGEFVTNIGIFGNKNKDPKFDEKTPSVGDTVTNPGNPRISMDLTYYSGI